MKQLLGTAVAVYSEITFKGTATVSVAQLITGDVKGTVFVTVTGVGQLESQPRDADVLAAPVTDPLADSSQIVVVNNAAGTSDTITVTGLAVGDKIKVYSDAKMTRLLGTATAALASKNATTATATIKLAQLPTGDAKGSVYVTVTSAGKKESTPLAGAYDAAKQTQWPH